LFGLVGVGGALASMAAGRLTDSRDPRQVVAVGSAIYLASFAVFALAGHTIAGLIAGVVLLDLGVQSGHVSNMALNMSIRGGAMSRINTIYMASRFGGGALGSSLGIWAWSLWHWPGVCGVGLLVGCASLILQVGRRSKSLREAQVD
jgi:predicted MFS family arabinose efflux permease